MSTRSRTIRIDRELDRKISEKAQQEKRSWTNMANLILEEAVKDKVEEIKHVTTKAKTKRFTPPTNDDVLNYMVEKGLTMQQASFESDKFWSFYDSKNWKVGNTKMANWKSAVTGWIKRNEQRPSAKISGQHTAASKVERVANRIENLFG